jgi:phospholipid-translocating ATPase
MELKKLHLGTMSYGLDSMDEVSLQLANAFGANSSENGPFRSVEYRAGLNLDMFAEGSKTGLVTGAMLATRGRRDMSTRVRDVALALALCHNVRAGCVDV